MPITKKHNIKLIWTMGNIQKYPTVKKFHGNNYNNRPQVLTQLMINKKHVSHAVKGLLV